MFSVKGLVEKGESRGSSIGFPTINIAVSDREIQLRGVYAVRINIGHNVYDGVANIGYAPTFSRKEFMVEVHIFSFSGDIYGKEVEVSFVSFLRDEKKFSGVGELKEQIAKDISKAREILKTL